MPRLALAVVLLASLTLAACGGGQGSSSSSEPAASAQPQTGTVDVGMNRLRFEPANITVKVGTRIVWTNQENVPHNVVAQSGAQFESEVFDQGKTYEYVAKTPGEIAYVCTLHPGMEGTITVVQ